MSRRRYGVCVAAAMAFAVVDDAPSAHAAKKVPASVKVSAPASVTAGSAVTVNVRVRPSRGALRKSTLRVFLSTDKKRDGKDRRLVNRKIKLLKARKTKTYKLRSTIPATTGARSYRLLACLTSAKATRCANRRITVRRRATGGTPPTPPPTPGPADPAPGGPGPVDPGTPGNPAPVVIDDPSPAPGPTDAAAPNPVTRADELPTESTTSHREATEFLYTGASPIQPGVAAGTITIQRSAVLRGRVLNRLGGGIAGVRVTVADHPELGRTATRDDGGYDIAVNGGGPLTLVFEREGYISGQRMVQVPYQDTVPVDTIVLVPYDPRATIIDTSGANVLEARGTTIEDDAGRRTQTLLFEPGTTAEMVVGGETRQIGNVFTVRSTEFTQGDRGPEAMPGQLPPTTAYTYAAEFSIDAAVQAGATDVRFSKPVPTYVENFIGLPVGTGVPAGYYDRQREAWVGAPDGRVVRVVDGGIDTDGDGSADNTGIDDAERAKVLSLYAAGTELWRVEIAHFTPWDYNYPYGPAPGAGPPGPGTGPAGPRPPDDPCPGKGSVILCDAQVLGEEIPIVGGGERLVYRSDRVPGRQTERTLQIRLQDGALDSSLQGVDLAITVAGRTFRQAFTRAQVLATPTTTFVWDGEDAYGRSVQGAVPVTVAISYRFKAVYQAPPAFSASWARVSGTPVSSAARGEFSLTKTATTSLASFDARGVGLGGWTLSDHHVYDPQTRTITRGDGGFGAAEPLRVGALTAQSTTATTLDGTTGIAAAPDGALVVADTRAQRILRVAADGTTTTIAGSGAFGYRPADDGGPATSARLSSPQAVAVFEDGAGQPVVVVADTSANRVRRVAPDGTIQTIAGGGTSLGDDGPATAARLSLPAGVAVAPDGTIYVSDTGQHRVRMIGTDGRITTVAGTGSAGFGGDGGRAALARLRAPQGLAVTAAGDLLIADTGNQRIRRVGADGAISTLAGGGSPGDDVGDGLAPADAALDEPTALALRRSGALVVADPGAGRIRELTVEGIVRTIAGGGTEPRAAGVPAVATALSGPIGVAVGADDVVSITEPGQDRISRVVPELPGFSGGDALIASPDGSEVYQFNLDGRHVRTLDAPTGAVLRRFTYDADGRLVGVFDDAAGAGPAHSALLTITRPSASEVRLTARGGARTTMTLDGQGWAAGVSNPANEVFDVDHSASGLLIATEDAEGGAHAFVYDAQGRLTRDRDPDGLVQTLTRTTVPGGTEVALSSPGGRTTKYRTVVDALGQRIATITEPSGAATVTTTSRDGTRTTVHPDGSTDLQRSGPDPRFGMQAPITTFSRTTSPSGKTTTTTGSRTITMRDATRLQTSTETATVDGKAVTRTFTAEPGDNGGSVVSTSPAGRQSRTVFDDHGRVVSGRVGDGLPVTTTYDDADDGRISEQEHGSRQLTYDYNARGRVATRTSGEGRTTTYTYDAADRMLTSTTGGQTTTITYDDNGRRLSLEHPGGRTTTFTHSPGGRSDTMTLPGGQTVDRSYTTLQALNRQTLPTGALTDTGFVADTGQTRIATRTDRNTSGGAAVATRTFGYLGDTDLPDDTRWTAGARTQDLDTAYDGDVPLNYTYAGAADGSIDHTLGATGFQFTSTTVDAGSDAARTYTFTRDNDRMVTGYGPFTVSRDAQTGAAQTYGDAADDTQVQSVDTKGFGELDERRVTEGGDELYELTVTRDDEGRVQQRTETIDGGAPITRTYAYDSQGRLDNVRDGASAPVEDYAYNGNGDRTSARSEDHAAQAATYNATTGLQTAAGALAMSFDADGFLTARGSDAYDYAPGGELLTAEAGATTITYAYDVMGRRTARSAGGDDLAYLYGNRERQMEVTATVDDAGALTTYFYDEYGHLHALERGGARYRVGTDQIGTPRVVVDADGTIVKRVDRDTWGRVLGDSAPAFSLPIGFAGGIEDPDTGLVRFGMRDYDPETGRFTARDPAFQKGSPANLFAYADSSPASHYDPLGLTALTGGLCIGGCVGAQVSISWDEGIGWCQEVGAGAGGGFEVDLLGKPDQGQYYVTEGSAKFGIIGGSLGVEETWCPPKGVVDTKYVGKVSAGPIAGQYDSKDGVSGLQLSKAGLELGAKTVYKECDTWTWSDLAGYL